MHRGSFAPITEWFASRPQFAARLANLHLLPSHRLLESDVVELFTQCSFVELQSARLKVMRMSVALLESLEKAVPGLKDLTITAGDFVGRKRGTDGEVDEVDSFSYFVSSV